MLIKYMFDIIGIMKHKQSTQRPFQSIEQFLNILFTFNNINNNNACVYYVCDISKLERTTCFFKQRIFTNVQIVYYSGHALIKFNTFILQAYL